ncbi:hypothetical protein SLS62_005545 [Diatrype stigma]|uniref:Glycosyl transferase CAP10 domain-containing protein n=1 Tax=Diatrype stigma TaxID=117547 RepID=A0AAN9UT12_9PEZI
MRKQPKLIILAFGTGGSKTLFQYAVVALVWGIAATDLLYLTERDTGAICPPGWGIERMTPLAQLLAVACDAWVVTQIGNLRQDSENRIRAWPLLATLFFTAAAVLAFLSTWSYWNSNNVIWSVVLTWVSIRDLVLDSIGVAAAILSSIYLLEFFQPMTVGLVVMIAGVSAPLQSKVFDGTLAKVWSQWWGLTMGVVVFLAPGILLRLGISDKDRARTHVQGLVHKYRSVLCAMLALLLVTCQVVLLSPRSVPLTPATLIANAKVESDGWIASAKRSTSLASAVLEYRKRYGMPPPPNFDKWHQFAEDAKSPIIDTFDQIHSDLLPFWGLRPAEIRQRTSHLLEHPQLSMGGIIIQDGQVEISPLVDGPHRWMMDVTKSMIDPFAQWLPNMQLAFNLDDECRISVPHADMHDVTTRGLASQSMLGMQKQLSSFSETQSPPWSQEYLDLDEFAWEKSSPLFVSRSRGAIFDEWISSTCPPDAPVHQYHWWNKKAECMRCSAPHMTDGFLSNWTLSGDLCHQPDLAYLHGFLLSPSALNPSHTLFPVFSQGRVQNFADILYPSPWNYGDKVEYEKESGSAWEKKMNSVYWRGASSDGYGVHGTWQTFARARFVYMFHHAKTSIRRGFDSLVTNGPIVGASLVDEPIADKATEDEPIPKSGHRRSLASFSDWTTTLTTLPDSGTLSRGPQTAVNVSFIGNFARCEESDCSAQHQTFYGSLQADPPPAMDFQEHWRHRHLVDLDGAGFSGRFPPFLESGSLPYRAALFRTWWEERIHAWRHFVPLDLRLHEFRSIMGYLGADGQGDTDAEEMARAGQEWASQALRKEDMRVYMFRLLLEWGRIVDDNREALGFDT